MNSIEKPFWRRAVRGATIPAVFVLGGLSVMGLKSQSEPNKPPVQPSAQALDLQTAFEQVADKLRPSVVFIKTRQTTRTVGMNMGGQDGDDTPFRFMFPGAPGGQGGQGNRRFRQMPMAPRRAYASGSGVIVRADGYILTNDHVVQGADKVTVRLQDGREFTGQVKRDYKSDLALIKIDATGLPAAEIGDSDRTKVGQWAVAFGSPFGLNDTMTAGIVSSLHRNPQIGGPTDTRVYTSLIQTDASINPGNSGGPLVDIYGRIIGINVAIESPSGGNVGIGFAIPANTAKYVMEQLISKGSVTRGFLGLAPKSLTFDEQKRYSVKEGALVASVQDGTPAAKAGFQVEDVIVRFDGKDIKDDAGLRDAASRTKPGTTVPVVVIRSGNERTLNVTVGTAEEPKTAQAEEQTKDATQGKLGVRIADANDAEARRELNVKGSATEGALIVEVVPGSPASEIGLRPGDVIVRINGRQITNAAALTDTVRSLKTGSIPVVIRRGEQVVLAQLEWD